MIKEKQGRAFPAMTMTRRTLGVSLAASGMGALLAACTHTVRLEVQPITIYAKLDADVRLRLDEDVKALIQQNPNLF